MLYYNNVKSGIGIVTVVFQDNFIIRLLFPNNNRDDHGVVLNGRPAAVEQNDLTRLCERQLNEYFEGKRHGFTLPLRLDGTEFQKKIWNTLAAVPYGKTVSYSELAESAGVSGARAVGNAVGKNPIPIIIPCHRVIHSDGSIGGFSGGLPLKIKLLELEGIRWRPNK